MGSDSPRPRLVHITTVCDSLVFFAGQIGFMKQRGFDVSLIASPAPELDDFGKAESIATYGVPMQRKISPIDDVRAVLELSRLLARIRPHVVHTHTPKAGFLGMLAATLTRVPVRIYQMRGLLVLTAMGHRKLLLSSVERASCRLAHHVICNSRSLREVALSERLCVPEHSEVLLAGSGNGVDSQQRFNPERHPEHVRRRIRQQNGIPEDALVAGFVGRLVGDKGIHELAAAWQSLRDAFPNAHLLVVGPFEPRDPVRPEVRRDLESDPRIHLAGFQRETAEFYAAMDLLVLPTYREGFPNVILEASSMGLPVVSTQVPGCVDAVRDGVTGLLVPAKDADALGAAMRRYLESAALREAHGKAGREWVVEQFDRERLWEALAGVYRRLLRENAAVLNAEPLVDN